MQLSFLKCRALQRKGTALRVHAQNKVPDPSSNAKKQEFVKGLSPDVLELFHDAQTNILELNKSRLLALEELSLARERIQELEHRLAESEARAKNMQSVRAREQQSLEAAPSSAHIQAASNAAPPYSAPHVHGNNAAAKPDLKVIKLAYSTGWDQAFIHYKKKDGKWTETPGQRMQSGQGDFAKHFVVDIDTDEVEFVFNNGRDDWDSPGWGQNYSISGRGTYRVKSGKVTPL